MSLNNKDSGKSSSPRRPIRAEVKTMAIGGSVLVLAISGLLIGFFVYDPPQDKQTFTFGVRNQNIYWCDPVRAWFAYDPVSYILLDQLTEGLYTTEFIGDTSQVVPNLAESGIWSPDRLNFTCRLKEGIEFHDGSPLTANDVKWNMDRLHYLYDKYELGDYILQHPFGGWIINRTEVMDNQTIKFVLNNPFQPLKSLLSAQYTHILKPKSTIEQSFITSISSALCGTGPFMFHEYTFGQKITLLPNENYWNNPNTSFDKVEFILFPPGPGFLSSVLNHQISLVKSGPYDSNVEIMNNTQGLTVRKTIFQSPTQFYMNNQIINVTMRKAISYVFNYSHVNEVSFGGRMERMRTPIPELIQLSHSAGFDLPFCNISLARQTLLDVNWNNTSGLSANYDVSPGNPWEIIAESATPVATYNYSYHSEGDERYFPFLESDLKQIGVRVIDDECGKFEWTYKLYGTNGYNKSLELFPYGWNPDYNDPFSAIYYSFSNNSDENFTNVNDTQLQFWIDQTLHDTNETNREELFYYIQKRLIEEIYPTIMLKWDLRYDVYVSNLCNVPKPNIFKFSFKDIYFS